MSRQLATPSPSPPRPVPTPTLPAQINSATQKQHAALNRLVTARLPLGLPPKTSDPAVIGMGIHGFARLYFAFEGCWAELFDSVEKDDECLTGTHDAQLRRWLATLLPPGLKRSYRLVDDLESMSKRCGFIVAVELFGLTEMLDAIKTEIHAKPHILLAYGWVMYMAIFSGGRWIRQQLSTAGPEFWIGDDTEDTQDIELLDMPGFSFLSFDGTDDGEDIKALFKARLAEAETLLTQQERQEVVDAAQLLFSRCIDIVGMIDEYIFLQKLVKALPWIGVVLAFALYLWLR